MTHSMPRAVLAWHFDNYRRRDSGPILPTGDTLRHDGLLKMCASGLHASLRVIDALKYAPGPWLSRVRCGGDMHHDTDNLVCRERTILHRDNMFPELIMFARHCALAESFPWTPPREVRDFLRGADTAPAARHVQEVMREAALAARKKTLSAAADEAISVCERLVKGSAAWLETDTVQMAAQNLHLLSLAKTKGYPVA